MKKSIEQVMLEGVNARLDLIFEAVNKRQCHCQITQITKPIQNLLSPKTEDNHDA